MSRKHYSTEFRDQVVELYKPGRSTSSLSREFGPVTQKLESKTSIKLKLNLFSFVVSNNCMTCHFGISPGAYLRSLLMDADLPAILSELTRGLSPRCHVSPEREPVHAAADDVPDSS